MSKMTSESWIQLEALLEDYMGSEVDREMANAIKALAKGYAHDRAAACVAEALADPLAALEALAKDEYCAILRTGGEESFTVSVYREPDMTKGGFHYWIAEPGEDEATEVPREEAQAVLLAGKGAKP